MGFLAVLLAALGGFAVGAVWYMVLSKPWMKAANIPMRPDGKPDGNGSALPFLLSAIAMIIVAGMMRHVFAMAGIDTIDKGLISGLGIGAFFIAPWTMINNAYGMRPFSLTMIDSGYAILGCGVIGTILTALG